MEQRNLSIKQIEASLASYQVKVSFTDDYLWREKKDMFRGVSPQGPCLVQIMMQKSEDAKIEAKQYEEMIRMDQKQRKNLGISKVEMVLKISQHLVIVNRLRERNILRSLQVQNVDFQYSHNRAMSIALNLLERASYFRKSGWLLQDQIGNIISLKGEKVIVIPSLIQSDNMLKDQVYSQYIQSRCNEEYLFAYPPEILEQVLNFSQSSTIHPEIRGEKSDVWAIGALLYKLIGGSCSTLTKLCVLKHRQEGMNELKEKANQYYDLFERVFDKEINTRLSIEEFKFSVQEIIQQFHDFELFATQSSIEKNKGSSSSGVEKGTIQVEELYNQGRRILKKGNENGMNILKNCINAIKKMKTTYSLDQMKQESLITEFEVVLKMSKYMTTEEAKFSSLTALTSAQNEYEASKEQNQKSTVRNNIFHPETNILTNDEELFSKLLSILAHSERSNKNPIFYRLAKIYLDYQITRIQSFQENALSQPLRLANIFHGEGEEEENKQMVLKERQKQLEEQLQQSYNQVMYNPTIVKIQEFQSLICDYAELSQNSVLLKAMQRNRVDLLTFYFQNCDKESAQQIIQSIVVKAQHPEIIIQFAQFFFEMSNQERALDYVEVALKLSSEKENLECLILKAKCMESLGDNKSSLSILHKCAKEYPVSTDYIELLVKQLLQQNLYEEAFQYFKKLQYASDSDEFYQFGLRCKNQSLFEQASLSFTKCLEINPTFADAQLQLAYAYQEMKEIDKFLESYLLFCQMKSDHSHRYILLLEKKIEYGKTEDLDAIIQLHLNMSDEEKFLTNYNSLLPLLSSNQLDKQVVLVNDLFDERLCNHSHILSRFQKCQKAKNEEEKIKSFLRLYEDFKFSYGILYKICQCLIIPKLEKKQKEQIISILEQAVKINPKAIECRYRLALQYIDLLLFDQAMYQLKELLKTNENHSSAMYLYGSILLQNKKDNKLALKYLKKSLRICDQGLPNIYRLLGVAYWKLGKVDKSIPHLLLSLEMKESDAHISQYVYGKCLLLKENVQLALETFQRLLLQISVLMKLKVVFYMGLCKHMLGQDSISFIFQSALGMSDKFKLKYSAMKFAILLELKKREFQSLSQLKSKNKHFFHKIADCELLALLAESEIEQGYHPFTVIKYIEQVFKESRFEQEDAKLEDIKECIYEMTKENEELTGCYVMEAKILNQIGQNNRALKKIEAVRLMIQQMKLHNKNRQKTRLEVKQEIKASWTQFNWEQKADFIQIDIYISLKMFNQAEDLVARLRNEQGLKNSKEVIHAQAMLMLQKNEQKAKTMFYSNKKYEPSQLILVEKMINAKNFNEARVLLQLLNKNIPRNFLVLKLLGDLEYQNGNISTSCLNYKAYVKGVQSQNDLLQEDEKSMGESKKKRFVIQYDYISLAQLAQFLYSDNLIAESLQMTKISLSINPNQPKTFFWQGKCKMRQKKYKEALKSFHQSEALDQNAEIYCYIGQCYSQLSDYETAKVNYEKAEFLTKNHFLNLRCFGEVYLIQKDYINAEKYFKSALDISQNDETSLINMAYCVQEKDGDLIAAKAFILKSLENNKQSSNQRSMIEYFKLLKKTKSKPDDDFLRTYKVQYSSNHLALLYLGEFFFSNEISGLLLISMKSLEFYSSLISLQKYPEFGQEISLAFLRLAQIHYAKYEFQKSLSFLKQFKGDSIKPKKSTEQIVPLNQQMFEALLLESRLKIQLNMINIEKPLFKCIQLNPQSEVPYFELAFYFHSIKCSKAWEFLRQGLELYKKNNSVHKSEAPLLLQALQQIEEGNTEQGSYYLKQCLSAFPNSSRSKFYLAQLELEKKNLKEALKCFKESLGTGVNYNVCQVLNFQQHAQARCQIVKILCSLNQKADAIHSFQACPPYLLKSRDIQQLMSTIYLQDENYSQALQYVESSLSSIKQNQTPNSQIEAAQTYYIKAKINLSLGNYLFAISDLNTCSQLNPSFPFIFLKIAAIYKKLSKPSKQLEYYIKHLSLFPESAFALCNASKLLIQTERRTLAQTYVSRLLLILSPQKIFPKQESIKSDALTEKGEKKFDLEDKVHFDDSLINGTHAHFIQSCIFYQEKNIPDAIQELKSNLKINPIDEDTLSLLARIYTEIGNNTEAIELYELLLLQPQIDSNNLAIYQNNLGNAYQKISEYSKAIKLYQKAANKQEDYSIEIFSNLSLCYIQQGKYEKAIQILVTNLSHDNRHKETLYLLGKVHELKKDNETSRKYYQKSIQIEKSYSLSCYSLALLNQKIGKVQESLQICKDYLHNCQQDIKMQVFLANIFIQAHNTHSALSLFHTVISTIEQEGLNEKNESIYEQCKVQIVHIYLKHHKIDHAITTLQDTLIDSPSNFKYKQELAMLMNLKGKHQEALNLLQEALISSPGNTSLLFNIADTYHQMEEYSNEVLTLQECQSLSSPFSEKIYNNLALAYESLQQNQLALITFKKGLLEFPESKLLHFNLGNFYLTSGNLKEAEHSFESCLLNDESNFEALNNLGLVLVRQRNYSSAIECYRKCLDLHPKQKDVYLPKIKMLLKVNVKSSYQMNV